MTWHDVFHDTFKALREQTGADTQRQVDFMLPSWPMIEACRANELDSFLPFIAAGKLTADQMHHACQRYCLGKTKTGTPIFWMIDDILYPLDAHIGDTWMSKLLKQREPILDCWKVQHCLFGLHVLGIEEGRHTISIVESEASAVVLSELFPESIWMAYATPSHLVPDLFAPLEGQTVTIYPRTDPTLSTYLFFRDLVNLTLETYDLDLSVDTILDDHATDAQKDQSIDLVDYLISNLNS